MIDPSYIEEILIPPDRLQARICELGAAVDRLVRERERLPTLTLE